MREAEEQNKAQERKISRFVAPFFFVLGSEKREAEQTERTRLGSSSRPEFRLLGLQREERRANIRALIIRIGFWGPLYYTYKKEPPK